MKFNMPRDNEFSKRLRSLMIPIAFQNLMLAAVSAGDSAMLGFVDENAMAAVSLAGNVQFVENLFLSAIVCSGTVLTSQYWGKTIKNRIKALWAYIKIFAGCFCCFLRCFGYVSVRFDVCFHK